MTDAEKIMRRKAKRLSKAQTLLSYLTLDIQETTMSDKEKDWLLKQIETIQETVQNDDKEDNIHNS